MKEEQKIFKLNTLFKKILKIKRVKNGSINENAQIQIKLPIIFIFIEKFLKSLHPNEQLNIQVDRCNREWEQSTSMDRRCVILITETKNSGFKKMQEKLPGW